MSKSTGHLTVAMVALFVAWPFAAVAQSDWQTSTEVRKLYEVARAEGEVVIWGAQRRELACALNANFISIPCGLNVNLAQV